MSAPADWVVLFHHGHSGWAPSGCFTGWADISLTGVGLAFDEVRGSVLRRTFVLVPRLAAGRRILAMSHGNTLCGLVMHLDGPSPETMERVETPSADLPLHVRSIRDRTSGWRCQYPTRPECRRPAPGPKP